MLTSLPQVDVAGDGGTTGVPPVLVLRRQLLGMAGLDSVDPTFRYRQPLRLP